MSADRPAHSASVSGNGQQRGSLVEQAAALLHKRCKIQVKDGRILVGAFTCLDKQGNIILTNTHEHLQLNGELHEKLIGQVLVPAVHRVSCEFEAMPDDVPLRQLLDLPA